MPQECPRGSAEDGWKEETRAHACVRGVCACVCVHVCVRACVRVWCVRRQASLWAQRACISHGSREKQPIGFVCVHSIDTSLFLLICLDRQTDEVDGWIDRYRLIIGMIVRYVDG